METCDHWCKIRKTQESPPPWQPLVKPNYIPQGVYFSLYLTSYTDAHKLIERLVLGTGGAHAWSVCISHVPNTIRSVSLSRDLTHDRTHDWRRPTEPQMLTDFSVCFSKLEVGVGCWRGAEVRGHPCRDGGRTRKDGRWSPQLLRHWAWTGSQAGPGQEKPRKIWS